MLTVVDEAQVLAVDEHAAWSESFNELFAQVVGEFRNAAVRRHGRAYLLGLALIATEIVSEITDMTSGDLAQCADTTTPAEEGEAAPWRISVDRAGRAGAGV